MNHWIFKHLLPFIIGCFVFLISIHYVVFNFQWSELAKIHEKISYGHIILLIPITLINFAIRALRWNTLLSCAGVHPEFIRVYFASVASISAAILTPFGFGEVIKIELLNSIHKVPRSLTYTIFWLEKSLDLLTLIGFLVIFSFIKISELSRISLFLLTTSLSAFLLVVIVFSSLVFQIYKSTKFYNLVEFVPKFVRKCCLNKIYKRLIRLTRMISPLCFILTLLNWLSISLVWKICIESIAVNISFFSSVFLVAFVTIANILSFVPGAVGVSEVGITEFLVRNGASHHLAQGASLIIRGYGLALVIVSLIHLIYFQKLFQRLKS